MNPRFRSGQRQLVLACLLISAASCGRFESPTVEGQAFLVMKSLDVKKLGDLPIYLLNDPNSAIMDLKKEFADQYKARLDLVRSNSAALVIEQRIGDLKQELANIADEKKKAVEGIEVSLDAKLRTLREDTTNLASVVTNLEKRLESFIDRTNSVRKDLDELKRPRREIELECEKRLDAAARDLTSVERERTDYIGKALRTAAKLVNDQVLRADLKVDLIPTDGKFGPLESAAENRYISIYTTRFRNEIFESEVQSYGSSLYFALDITPGARDYLKKYLVFRRFPAIITDSSVRQAFHSSYLEYSAKRTTLDAEANAAKERLASLTEEERLALQKYDFQFKEAERLRSIESQLADTESEIGSLQSAIAGKNAVISANQSQLDVPRTEEVAAMRREIESSFSERHASVAHRIEAATEERDMIVRNLSDLQWKILKDALDDKLASTISAKIAVSARTDADGKFKLTAPTNGVFILYARMKTPWDEEVFWFERVPANGKTAVKLTNSNSQQAKRLAELLLGDLQVFRR